MTTPDRTAALSSNVRWIKARVLQELGHDPDVREQVGRYLLQRPLGQGAHGYVWVGYDPELGREVAIKMPRRPGAEDRLLAEARALAKVKHRNVVEVYEVGSHDGEVWMAMALVEGSTLREWLEHSRTRGQRLRVIRELAEGLAALHDAGLVHGDVKPENVMVTPEGETVLTDFGGSRSISTIRADRAGTRRYWAPEIWNGAQSSPAADQYAFARTAIEVYWTSLSSSWARRLTVWTRPRLGRLLNRALQPEPERRWASMAELAHKLSHPKPGVFVAVAGVAAGLVLGLGIRVGASMPPPTEPSSLPSAPVEFAMVEALELARQGETQQAFDVWERFQIERLGFIHEPWMSERLAEVMLEEGDALRAAWVADNAAQHHEGARAWLSAARARNLAALAYEAAGGWIEADIQVRCAAQNELGGRCFPEP